MEDMVHVKINGIAVEVPKGSTILEAARYAGVEIPTLCFLKDINEIGACRICVVEATGARGLVTACVYPVSEGMEVQTNTAKVQAARRTTLELILSIPREKMPFLCAFQRLRTAEDVQGLRRGRHRQIRRLQTPL